MINNITIGRYLPTNSVLHRLDPRIKLIITIMMVVMTFFTMNYVSLMVITLLTFSFILLSKIPMKIYLKGFKFIFMVIFFTAILNLFFKGGEIIFQIGIIKITKQGINSSIFIALRLLDLAVLSSVLTLTTMPTDLTYALEFLMKPLKRFKVDVSSLAMMITITLRFIPTIFEETGKIMNAQKARGSDIESGNLKERISSLIPVFVPLFVSSFRRAYELAIAMESRCYMCNGQRTSMKTFKLQKRDTFASVFAVMLLVGMVIANVAFPGVAI